MIKNISFLLIGVGLLMVIAAFTIVKTDKGDFETAREIIVMRNIAHQVLQYTGDSSSPIAPVVRISASEFQIPFESSFSFKPDSLVRIIDRVIAGNKLPSSYIVNVLERKTDKVIYGYAMLGPRQQNIVPCLGRDEPVSRYTIDIRFQENKLFAAQSFYISGGSMLGLGLLMFAMSGYKRQGNTKRNEAEQKEVEPKHIDPPSDQKPSLPIGKYIFFADENLLKLNGQDTVLTVKESRILSIFANAPNQVIDRRRLQKEIWEDEGVIVGRSLDMFISRLRKKLEQDPDVAIVNIHSIGYKLEISARQPN